jgi:excisionase family DNA binding protein
VVCVNEASVDVVDHTDDVTNPDDVTEATAADLTRQRHVLTVAEAAAYLRISRSAAYRRVEDGTLPVLKLGSRLRVPVEALENLLRSVDPTLRREQG